MPYLQLLFPVHLLLLVYVNGRTARLAFASDVPRLLATAVLMWATLVFTAQAISVASLLGSPVAYFTASFGMSWLLAVVVRWTCPVPVPADGFTFATIWVQLRASWLSLVLLAMLAAVTVAVLLTALAVLPNNWDSLAYRFPRVFFYLNAGALVHAKGAPDQRLLFYPYDGTLLYLFLAQYQLPGVTWNLVSVVAWLLAGAGAFYGALTLGGSVRAAMFSTYALLTAPIVLCVANSTNDELLSGAPLLVGIVFLAMWLRDRMPAHLLFGAVGLALSAGVKLHALFYAPGLVLAVLLTVAIRRPLLADLWRGAVRPHPRVVCAALMLSVPLAGGFTVTNYVSAGMATNTDFNRQVLRLPFSARGAAQNVALLTAQLFLAPLPDHARVFGVDTGVRAYQRTNEVTNRLLFANVRQGPPYTSPFYRFRGIASPLAEVFFEETLWLGMVPWALALALIWMATRWRDCSLTLWMMMLSLPAWHLGLSTIHLYVEAIGVYYAYAAPASVAALGVVWERMDKAGGGWRIASWCLVIVLGSNTLLAGALLLSSQKRNVLQAFSVGNGETGLTQVSPDVRTVVGRARTVYIGYTHWETLYWNLMRLNPSARYVTADYSPAMDIDLFLWTYYSEFNWDTPATIRADRVGSFKWLGTMSLGGEVVVCGGRTCRAECPRCDDLMLMPLRIERQGLETALQVAGPTQGLDAAGPGAVRFTLFNEQSQAQHQSAWVPAAALSTFRMGTTDQAFDHVLVEVGCEPAPSCSVSRTVLSLAPGKRPLLDTMPEPAAIPAR